MLTAARTAGEHDAFPHGFKQWTARLKVRFIAAHHDAQSGVARATVAAAHRRVQRPEAPLLRLSGDALPQRGTGRGHVDQVRAGPGAVQNTARRQVDLLHVLGKSHDGNHGVLVLRARTRTLRPGRALRQQAVRLALGTVVYRQAVTFLHQVTRHALAHYADADKADLHCCCLLADLRLPYHITAPGTGQDIPMPLPAFKCRQAPGKCSDAA